MAQLRSRPTKTETVVKTELAITKKKSAVAKKPKVVKQTFTAKDEDVESKFVILPRSRSLSLKLEHFA